MLVWKKILWLRERIREQRKWLDDHGGDLAGYIARYGDPGVPPVDANGNPKIVVVPKDKAHFLDGYCELHPDEDKMPGVNTTKFYQRHYGDGGTAIYNADHGRLLIWERELSELSISSWAAVQKANEVESLKVTPEPAVEEASVAWLRNAIENSLANIAISAATIKSDDVVDDDACDGIVASAQHIATSFNSFLKRLGSEAIQVPEALEPSPYQLDDDDD